MDSKELKYFLFASIISADNDLYTEEVKQAIISRYDKNEDFDNVDWEYVLEPLGEDAARYIKILKEAPIQNETKVLTIDKEESE